MDGNIEKSTIPSYSDKYVDQTTHYRLQHLVAPHVDSFDYFLEHGLTDALEELTPMEFDLSPTLRIKLQYSAAKIEYPAKRDENSSSLYTPREAREGGSTYSGATTAALSVTINDNEQPVLLNIKMGDLPIRAELSGIQKEQAGQPAELTGRGR